MISTKFKLTYLININLIKSLIIDGVTGLTISLNAAIDHHSTVVTPAI